MPAHQDIPGTTIPVNFLRDKAWARSKKTTTANVASLVSVIAALSMAVRAYEREEIFPASFYRKGKIATEPAWVAGGMIYHLAVAVVILLKVAGERKVPVRIYDGTHRHHTDFYRDMWSLMNYILRLPETYPNSAISRIEKFALEWVDRKQFWEVVMLAEQDNRDQD